MSLLDANVSNPKEGGPSFSFSNRLVRFAWGIVWITLGYWTPVPLHFWRRFLLKLFGANIHSTAKVYPKVKVWLPSNLEMKKYSCIASNVNCYSMEKIVLAEYSLVSQGAHLCAGTHDISDPGFQLIARPIVIGFNSWIAAESFVGPGVVVGEAAVLGARAVTFKDLQPQTVYIGNPATELRKRSSKL